MHAIAKSSPVTTAVEHLEAYLVLDQDRMSFRHGFPGKASLKQDVLSFIPIYKVVKTHRKHIKETQQSKIKDFLAIFLISKVKHRSLQIKIVTVDNCDFFAVSKQNTLCIQIFKWAGNGLLFHALRRNTIGAESFHVRVRNGIVCSPLALTTSPPNNL